MLQKFINFFQINYLEHYIVTNYPKSVADVERLERQYTRRNTCR